MNSSKTLLRHAAQLELLCLMHLAYLRPELSAEGLAQAHEELLKVVQSEEYLDRAEQIIRQRLET